MQVHSMRKYLFSFRSLPERSVSIELEWIPHDDDTVLGTGNLYHHRRHHRHLLGLLLPSLIAKQPVSVRPGRRLA